MKILQANETKILSVQDEVVEADNIEFDEEELSVLPGKKDPRHYLTGSEKIGWRRLSKREKAKIIRETMKEEQGKVHLFAEANKKQKNSGYPILQEQVSHQELFTAAERKEQKRSNYLKKKQKAQGGAFIGSSAVPSAYKESPPEYTRSDVTSNSMGQSGASANISSQMPGISERIGNNLTDNAGNVSAEIIQTGQSAAVTGGSDLAVKVAKKTAEKFRQEFEGNAARDEKKAEEVKRQILSQGGEGQSVTALTRGVGDKVVAIATTAVGAVVGVAANAASMVLTPLVGIITAIVIVFCVLFSVLSPSAVGGYQGVAHVSPEVEFYRPYLEKYAALYPGMENLVDLMLAMIMQEAGGEPWIGTMDGDIMQSSESAGYPGPGYLTGEASIAQGVKYLATEVFNRAGLLEDPYNLEKTKLALQGYNYGAGYIPWALENYGGYTEENAVIFSEMMAARLGWSNYGDKLYVQHVLRYYEIKWVGFGVSVSTSEVSNQETKERLEDLSSRWPLDLEEGRKNIILKGCTLVGYTTYDMYGEDTRAGVDLPRTLDCSSFVAWCFHKCGYTDVPYWSTTGTFLSASNFKRIDKGQLKPGDIGLINWVGSGGSNHVGIYVGNDASGTPMWLHCTSHTNPGSSIVTGPRISYYSAFTLFFRYAGFH